MTAPAAWRRSAPRKQPEHLVIRFPNWIGDVMMSLPVLDIAKEMWPGVTIGVQVHRRARTLLEDHPLVARVHPAPVNGETRFAEAIDSLRAARYDTGLLLTPSFSSAWILYLAGIPRRVGWTGEARSILLTDPVPKPGLSSRLVGQYQDLFRILGYGGPPKPLHYEEPPAARREADAWLANAGLTGADFAVLAPAALHGPAKRWPAPAYRELAERLVAGRGFHVVAVGSGNERAILDGVARGARNVHILAGDLGLPAVASLVRRGRVLVGNDTGLLHMGRAVGTPVVGLYGSTTPTWSGPAPEEGEAVYLGLSCSPCFRRECPLKEERLACLERIPVDEVEQAVGRVLRLPRRVG